MKYIAIIAVLLLVVATVFVSGCTESSRVCGTHTETYTSNAKGCDKMENCRCIHQGWGGLGACDSCECTKEVSNC